MPKTPKDTSREEVKHKDTCHWKNGGHEVKDIYGTVIARCKCICTCPTPTIESNMCPEHCTKCGLAPQPKEIEEVKDDSSTLKVILSELTNQIQEIDHGLPIGWAKDMYDLINKLKI